MKGVGQILGYDNYPYLIFLDLNIEMTIVFLGIQARRGLNTRVSKNLSMDNIDVLKGR